MANGLVNGYPYWLKLDESKAIWFNKVTSSWFFGAKKNLGTNFGAIAGPAGKDAYPNEIKQGWTFTSGWQDAGPNDVIFKAVGTFQAASTT